MLLFAIATLALGACATTTEGPEGSSPTDQLRKVGTSSEVHGDLQVAVAERDS